MREIKVTHNDNGQSTIEISFPTDSVLGDVIAQFEDALKACGYNEDQIRYIQSEGQ